MTFPYSFILLLFIVVSCNTTPPIADEVDCPPYRRHDTIHVVPPLPSFLSHTFHYTFEEEIPLNYCCAVRKNLTKWIRSLPSRMRDDMISQRLVVEKIYYLSPSKGDKAKKQKEIEAFEAALEHHMYIYIGMYQGTLSVVFSTKIILLNEDEEERLVIRLNQYRHEGGQPKYI